MNKLPSALYIHIPFCEHLCDYCDFPKLQYFTNFADRYLISLKQELDSYHITHPLETIYVGGGTPTSLNLNQFERLLSIIAPYTKGVKEYTFEANPESLSDEKLALLKKYGCNRLSIGVESTNDDILKAINRHHTFQDVKNAVLRAKNHSFLDINLDLIIGLPQATRPLLEQDITNLLALDVPHISCYALSVHPHTMFYLRHIEEPSDDLSREYYDIVEEMLTKYGYKHYEISNWAKPGFASLHNQVYWRDDHYYGVGLGASGYLSNYRYTNTKSLNDYLDGHYLQEKEYITLADDEEYFLMLTLRTSEGLSFQEYQDRFGVNFLEKYHTPAEKMIDYGWLKKSETHLSPTYEGMMVLDQIILAFLTV